MKMDIDMHRKYREPVVIQHEGETITWHGPRVQITMKALSWLYRSRVEINLARYQGIYAPLPYMPEDVCIHTLVMCKKCEESWSWDYAIRQFDYHGDQGYNQGCRCMTCITRRQKFLTPKQLKRALELNLRYRYLDAHQEVTQSEVREGDLMRWAEEWDKANG